MGGRTPHREGKSQSATSKPNTGGLTYAVEVKGICSECSLPQLKTRVIEHITELHGLSDGFVRARPSCKHGRSIRCTDNCDIARTRRFETVLMGANSEEGDSQERGEQDAQLGTHWSEDKAVSEFPLSAWCCDQSTAEMSLEGAPERERDASPGLGQTSEKKQFLTSPTTNNTTSSTVPVVGRHTLLSRTIAILRKERQRKEARGREPVCANNMAQKRADGDPATDLRVLGGADVRMCSESACAKRILFAKGQHAKFTWQMCFETFARVSQIRAMIAAPLTYSCISRPFQRQNLSTDFFH